MINFRLLSVFSSGLSVWFFIAYSNPLVIVTVFSKMLLLNILIIAIWKPGSDKNCSICLITDLFYCVHFLLAFCHLVWFTGKSGNFRLSARRCIWKIIGALVEVIFLQRGVSHLLAANRYEKTIWIQSGLKIIQGYVSALWCFAISNLLLVL